MKLLGQNFYKCLGNFPNKQEKELKRTKKWNGIVWNKKEC